MVNKVLLIGRLGRDPEIRYTPSGQAVANFRIATDESYKDSSGSQQKRTEWHTVVLWGKQAESAQQSLHKGSLVYVEGRIQTRSWDDKKTGAKRYATEVVANTLRYLEPKASHESDPPAAPEHPAPASEEDVPF